MINKIKKTKSFEALGMFGYKVLRVFIIATIVLLLNQYGIKYLRTEMWPITVLCASVMYICPFVMFIGFIYFTCKIVSDCKKNNFIEQVSVKATIFSILSFLFILASVIFLIIVNSK